MFIRGGSANEVLRMAETGGGAGDPPPVPIPVPVPVPAPTPTPTPRPGPETFSREYVTELREESAGHRTRAKTAEETATAAKAEAAKAKKDADDAIAAAKTEADAKVAAAQTAANERIIRAELKAEAIKAGMVDLDGLKLLDTSKVTIGDDGVVKIPDKFFEEAKTAKPWLFATTGTSTSSTATPPKPGDPPAKVAKDMTPDERKAALKGLGVTRF